MSSVMEITKDTFQAEVLASGKTVLVDFWAEWCGPCRIMSPIVDEIASERPDVKVGKVNVDNEGELAKEYNIRGIPTLLVFKNGEMVKRIVGVTPKEEILPEL